MTKEKKLKVFPHVGVLTYLGISKVEEGKLGVFALVPIKANANVFPNEPRSLFWVSEKELKKSKPSKQAYGIYKRLGVLEGDQRYTYPNFGALPNSAYIADNGETPNLHYGSDHQFYAMRRIRAGEELTVDYETIG